MERIPGGEGYIGRGSRIFGFHLDAKLSGYALYGLIKWRGMLPLGSCGINGVDDAVRWAMENKALVRRWKKVVCKEEGIGSFVTALRVRRERPISGFGGGEN